MVSSEGKRRPPTAPQHDSLPSPSPGLMLVTPRHGGSWRGTDSVWPSGMAAALVLAARAVPGPATPGLLSSRLGLRGVPAGLHGSWHLTLGPQAKRSFGVMLCPLGLTVEFRCLLLFLWHSVKLLCPAGTAHGTGLDWWIRGAEQGDGDAGRSTLLLRISHFCPSLSSFRAAAKGLKENRTFSRAFGSLVGCVVGSRTLELQRDSLI